MNRLIVAFSSDTAAHRICAWLAQSGFPARTVCRTGAEVVRRALYGRRQRHLRRAPARLYGG